MMHIIFAHERRLQLLIVLEDNSYFFSDPVDYDRICGGNLFVYILSYVYHSLARRIWKIVCSYAVVFQKCRVMDFSAYLKFLRESMLVIWVEFGDVFD